MTKVNYLLLAKAYHKALQNSQKQATFYQSEKDRAARHSDKVPPNVVRACRQQGISLVHKKHDSGLKQATVSGCKLPIPIRAIVPIA